MKKFSFLFLLTPFVFSLNAFAEEPESAIDDVSSSDPAPIVVYVNNNDGEERSEEASSPVAIYYSTGDSVDYSDVLDSIYQNSVSTNDLLSSLQEEVLKEHEHKDFNLYDSEDELLQSEFYVDRYQYETYKLLKYFVILQCCNVGLLLMMVFIRRSHKNGSS